MCNQPFAKECSILKAKRAAHRDQDMPPALEAQAGRNLGPSENLLEDPKGGEGPDKRADVVGTGPGDGKAACIKSRLHVSEHRINGPNKQVPTQGAALKNTAQDHKQGHQRATVPSIKLRKPVGNVIRRITCFSHEWARLGKAAAKSQKTTRGRSPTPAAKL